MAAPVSTVQVVYDNARNCVVKFTFVSGGADQAQTKVVDVAALNPPAGVHLKIRNINYDVLNTNGVVSLFWDAPPNPVHILDLRGGDHQDFRRFGGITNNGGANASGSILVSTSGFTLNSSYSVTLEMVKGI